ncbi:MAG TPA: ATP phosphoribosyltransferase [Actinocrinis sp.]|jgi:ATP phosphoribosyltransferase
MLRIAVPNKGSLAEAAGEMLHEAGYKARRDRELMLVDPANSAELFFLRPRDIAVYVGSGRLDVGITGRDLLADSGADAEEILRLGFGNSTFRFAAPAGAVSTVTDLSGRRIATSFPGVVAAHLKQQGVDAEIVRLDGAVEVSVQLGVADAIADVVETGSTLRQAGLEVVGAPILESEAVVVRRTGAPPDPAVDQFVHRMQGVLVARKYVLMDYDIRAEQLKAAVAVTPGLESPTVSPLHTEGWVAVRAMVARDGAQRVMDDLWQIGARAILVTDIRACRL